jgi:hypothetical protein
LRLLGVDILDITQQFVYGLGNQPHLAQTPVVRGLHVLWRFVLDTLGRRILRKVIRLKPTSHLAEFVDHHVARAIDGVENIHKILSITHVSTS